MHVHEFESSDFSGVGKSKWCSRCICEEESYLDPCSPLELTDQYLCQSMSYFCAFICNSVSLDARHPEGSWITSVFLHFLVVSHPCNKPYPLLVPVQIFCRLLKWSQLFSRTTALRRCVSLFRGMCNNSMKQTQ